MAPILTPKSNNSFLSHSASFTACAYAMYSASEVETATVGCSLLLQQVAPCHQTFTGIYHAIKAKVCHWAARGLSFLGRVHVAKQVLAASQWYHATFQRPSEQLLNQISSQLRNYVASTQQSSHSDAGMALAQGNSQNPAQPLSQAPTASLYPGQITSSLLPAKGGVGLVHMPTQVQALQAKVESRLLEPEQLAWKVFQNHHFGLAPQLQCLAYGASILFSTVSTQSLHLPARLNGYVTAFRALQPHRLLPVSAMHAENVLNEPLFFNRQITVPINASAGSTAQKPLMPQEHTILLTAGITKEAHVQAALQLHHPQALTACLQTVLLAMPAAWQTVASSASAPATWQQGLSASGNQLIQNAQTGQLHAINPS